MKRFEKMTRAKLIEELVEKEKLCSPIHEPAAIVKSPDHAVARFKDNPDISLGLSDIVMPKKTVRKS